jgi:NADH dehydrogenase/NADH:ubiquinone oxidoreductase subunit G
MSDFVFNIAKGAVAYYATLPATNDGLIVVLLKSSGLEADSTLKDYDTLALLLAGTSDEADFTNYGRKTITSVTVTVDDTNDRVDVDVADQTWTSAGGATNNTLGKLLVCYDPDTTGGTDSSVIPLAAHDFSATTDGTNLVAQVAASGFYRAS